MECARRGLHDGGAKGGRVGRVEMAVDWRGRSEGGNPGVVWVVEGRVAQGLGEVHVAGEGVGEGMGRIWMRLMGGYAKEVMCVWNVWMVA